VLCEITEGSLIFSNEPPIYFSLTKGKPFKCQSKHDPKAR